VLLCAIAGVLFGRRKVVSRANIGVCSNNTNHEKILQTKVLDSATVFRPLYAYNQLNFTAE
jgi:hypothetical protein